MKKYDPAGREVWLVMDGRAHTDPERACVFEAIQGARPRKAELLRDWGDTDACLCVSRDGGPAEFVETIGPRPRA